MPSRKVWLLLFLLVGFACQEPPQTAAQAVNVSLDSLLSKLGTKPADLELHIFKSARRLEVRRHNDILKTYPIVLGMSPESNKQMEGDRRTPEGRFGIRDMYPHAKWSRFIWIDYPTEASWQTHRQAKADGEIPQSATIGGEIGIHGVPEGRDDLITNGVDWTWGCISLTNADVNEIYRHIDEGTAVEIHQ